MDKRAQMRDLLQFDSEKNRFFVVLSWLVVGGLFLSVEKGWLTAEWTLLIGQLAYFPAMKKSWNRETIKHRYLTNEEAKRRIHLMTILSFMSFPILIILMYGWITNQIETPLYIGMMVTGGVISIIGHKIYERHMVRLDENYVTERELKKEREWGSA